MQGTTIQKGQTVFISCIAVWRICHIISAQDLIPFHEKGGLYTLFSVRVDTGRIEIHWNDLLSIASRYYTELFLPVS